MSDMTRTVLGLIKLHYTGFRLSGSGHGPTAKFSGARSISSRLSARNHLPKCIRSRGAKRVRCNEMVGRPALLWQKWACATSIDLPTLTSRSTALQSPATSLHPASNQTTFAGTVGHEPLSFHLPITAAFLFRISVGVVGGLPKK